MDNTENIRVSLDRVVKAITKQPSVAKGVIEATATYKTGLACNIECGPFKMTADMPHNVGGSQTGPTPGMYMAMALGSCQVITTMLWATRYGVPVEKLDIRVAVEKDSRGLFGVDEQPAHWRSIKYFVDIQSPASDGEIKRVLDAAHAHSPMRDNLEHPFTIQREVNITVTASKEN
jgi:uncharacterized OsmC-like protein